jgi:hypothetical protein
MWHLTQIPKHAHFYWGGPKLSYLRSQSIKTFQRLNPDWKISLHMPKVLSQALPQWDSLQQKNISVAKDYLDQINDVEIQIHDFEDYGFDNHAHEVHKSDFLRWRLLASSGGLWSDIDILYCRPMTSLTDNTDTNAGIDTILCPLSPPRKHTVGFLMSSAGNKFCDWMHVKSRDCYDPKIYQCMGSDVLNHNFANLQSFHDRFDHRFLFLDRNSVYAVTSKEIDKFFQPMDRDLQKKIIRSSVIGLHWFAGHPQSQEFETKFDHTTADQFDNILAYILKDTHET